MNTLVLMPLEPVHPWLDLRSLGLSRISLVKMKIGVGVVDQH